MQAAAFLRQCGEGTCLVLMPAVGVTMFVAVGLIGRVGIDEVPAFRR